MFCMVFLAPLLTGIITDPVINHRNIILSQEVAEDICRQLTENKIAVAKDIKLGKKLNKAFPEGR